MAATTADVDDKEDICVVFVKKGCRAVVDDGVVRSVVANVVMDRGNGFISAILNCPRTINDMVCCCCILLILFVNIGLCGEFTYSFFVVGCEKKMY